MVPLVYASLLFLIGGIIWRVVTILRAPPHPSSLRLSPASRHPVMASLGDVFGMTR